MYGLEEIVEINKQAAYIELFRRAYGRDPSVFPEPRVKFGLNAEYSRAPASGPASRGNDSGTRRRDK